MRNEFSVILDEIPSSGIRRFFDLVLEADDVISLGVGEPDFTTPWNVREEAIYTLEKGLTSYSSNKGLKELRDGLHDYMKERFKVSYDPSDEILVTVGGSEAIDLTLRALLNAGDEVIIPEPTFVCYAPLVKLAGGQVVSVDTSSYGFIPSPELLERYVTPRTKALILCSPNNPTGVTIPHEVLIQIAAFAEKHNLWVLSDEIYGELTYDDIPVSFASIPGMKKRTVVWNGFSKAFAMTGWRLGFLCGPGELVRRALKIHQYCMMCAPIIAQYAAIEALKSAAVNVEEMKRSYLFRRNWFVKQLDRLGLTSPVPGGAFYCFPSIQSTGLTSEEFAIRLLKEQRVAVVPGDVFGRGGEGHIRCCYATGLEELKEAVRRIRLFLESLGHAP